MISPWSYRDPVAESGAESKSPDSQSGLAMRLSLLWQILISSVCVLFFCTDGKSFCRVQSLKREQLQMPLWQAPCLAVCAKLCAVCVEDFYMSDMLRCSNSRLCAVVYSSVPWKSKHFTQLDSQFLEGHDISIFNPLTVRLLRLFTMCLFSSTIPLYWVSSTAMCLTLGWTGLSFSYAYWAIHFKAHRISDMFLAGQSWKPFHC